MTEELLELPHVKMAAVMADRFGLDPVQILKSNYRDWAIRVASYRYVVAKEEAAARAARSKQAHSRTVY